MRRIPKLIKWTALTALFVYAAALTHAGLTKADSPGQIEGGNIFQARNLTSGTNYADPASAKACEELKYNIQLHNPDFGQVSNLMVKVSLPAGSSASNVASMNASFSGGTVNSVSDTATVNLDSAQTISMEPGSAVLLDKNGNTIQSLSDALVNGGGANLGSLAGSGLEYVQFKAKVSCPAPPPSPVFSCDELTAQVGDNRKVTLTAFNVTAKNGATFKNADINWGDSSSDSGLTTVVGKTHQYAADGTYTISATAHFNVNGTDKTAGGANCMTTVKIKTQTPPPPPAPVFSCDMLSVKAKDMTVTITDFKTTARNGAKFKNVDINWGDSHSDNGLTSPVGKTHAYADNGTFTITATAHFDVNGQDKTADGATCQQTVTFKKGKPPVVTPPSNNNVNNNTNINNNTNVNNINVSGGQGAGAAPGGPETGAPAGTAEVAAPSQLVNTGPGSLIAIFLTATAFGTFAFRYFLRRSMS